MSFDNRTPFPSKPSNHCCIKVHRVASLHKGIMTICEKCGCRWIDEGLAPSVSDVGTWTDEELAAFARLHAAMGQNGGRAYIMDLASKWLSNQQTGATPIATDDLVERMAAASWNLHTNSKWDAIPSAWKPPYIEKMRAALAVMQP